MKKLVCVLLVFIFMVSLSPLVLAEEDEDLDEETLEETELIADSNKGAMVRMLQLLKSVTRNLVAGNEILDVLSEKDEDTTELEDILVSMEEIKMTIEDIDYDNDDVAGLFASIKTEMKELSKDFKSKVSGKLTAEDKQAVQDAVKESTEIEELKDEIREAIRNANADRVNRMLDNMGVKDEELIEKIKNGEATRKEVAEKLKEKWKGVSDEKKEEVRERVAQKLKDKKELRDRLKELRKNMKLKREEFKQLAKEKLENARAKFKEARDARRGNQG